MCRGRPPAKPDIRMPFWKMLKVGNDHGARRAGDAFDKALAFGYSDIVSSDVVLGGTPLALAKDGRLLGLIARRNG